MACVFDRLRSIHFHSFEQVGDLGPFKFLIVGIELVILIVHRLFEERLGTCNERGSH